MTQDWNIVMPYKRPFIRVAGPTVPNTSGIFNKNKGFTFVELLVVMVIIGILSTLAIPAFYNYQNRSKSFRSMSEIRTLCTEIIGYNLDKGTYPVDLAAINRGGYLDPWKRLYVYNTTPTLWGPLVKLNTAFDIYSMGIDGQSAAAYGDPLNKDDIALYNDGNYVGLR